MTVTYSSFPTNLMNLISELDYSNMMLDYLYFGMVSVELIYDKDTIVGAKYVPVVVLKA